MSTPLEAAQTKQTARRNTKWQPARWSQLSAHVETKLTSHSSHACAAHCGVLIHRWPPCDLPARSLVPPPTAKQKQKARLGSSANTKWQPGQWSQFSAHVQTDLTSHSSHASAAHCGVLTRRRLFCDTPAPSLVPPSKGSRRALAPRPTPNGSRPPGHNFRRTSKQSSPRILHTLPLLTMESSSTVRRPVTCQPHH